MSKEKLLPCPFCQGGAHIHSRGGDMGNWFWVSCKNPRCVVQKGSRKTEEEAITAWNTRYKGEDK